MKNFRLPIRWERTQLQFRADAFNIFNHANLGLPGNTTDSSAFGIITSASQPRKLQVGVQVSFDVSQASTLRQTVSSKPGKTPAIFRFPICFETSSLSTVRKSVVTFRSRPS